MADESSPSPPSLPALGPALRSATVGSTGRVLVVSAVVGGLTLALVRALAVAGVAGVAGVDTGEAALDVLAALVPFAAVLGVWRLSAVTGPDDGTDLRGDRVTEGRASAVRRLVADDPGTRGVLLLSAALFVGFTLYLSLRFRTFYLWGGDFGDYVHLFATTVEGTGFLQQAKFRAGLTSYWGAHFAVTLLGLLPAFALVKSPYTLLVAQSFALAASVPVLWLLARHHLGDDRLAGLVVASYALNPFLWSAWGNGFYEQAVLPALVFGTYYAYRRRAFRAFLVGVALAALTNEFVTLLMGGFLLGLTVVASRGDRLRAEARVLAVAFGVVVAVKLLSTVVIGHFNATPGIPLASLARPLRPVVEGPRTGTVALVTTVLSNPHLLPELLLIDLPGKVVGLCFLLIPVAFLAVGDETALGALAPFLLFGWLFAGKSGYYQFGGHYPLYVVPFVYVGTIRVLDRLSLPSPSRGTLVRATAVVLLLSAGVGVAALQGPFGLRPVDTPGERERLVAEAIDAVPRDETLVTQNDVYPHVATRPTARYVAAPAQFERYQRQHGPVRPEYVLVDRHSTHWSAKLTAGFGDRLGTEYGRYRAEDGVVLWKRGYDGPVEPLTTSSPGGE
jgi:uncharacterized membrane protein